MRDESKRAKSDGHICARYDNGDGVTYLETTGDEQDTPCPWCGKHMNLYDDAAYADSTYTCEHCGADMRLDHSFSVTVTATMKEKSDEDAGEGGSKV